jgi:aldose 1-epimerase
VTAKTSIYSEPFGVMPDGRVVERHVLKNRMGAEVSVLDYGAIISSILVPDRNGRMGEVTLGYKDLSGYLRDKFFLGAVVGRFANRIKQGRFTLDGKHYNLPINDKTNHLHGGPEGFYAAIWKSRWVGTEGNQALYLSLESADGAAGYPGTLQVFVRYAFDDNCRLSVDYEAVTTKPTVINLTQHAYFNLTGEGSILDHELQMDAATFTPTDRESIPTGELANVEGTAFDFRVSRRIGDRIDADEEQLKLAKGYDHNYVLDGEPGQMKLAALLHSGASGRTLRVFTTEPGMQLYTGNFLPTDSSITRGTHAYGYREGLCLETQHYPDSPNRPEFPSTRLEPGARFRSTTVFEFGVRLT